MVDRSKLRRPNSLGKFLVYNFKLYYTWSIEISLTVSLDI